MTVTQRSTRQNRAVVNWQSFNIASGESVQFVQPNSASLLVNRVVGPCSALCYSSIDGSMTANGRIMLINPNGILLGAGARVDVGALAATTIDFSNDVLMGGEPFASLVATNVNGFVINNGSINVRSGLAALVAPGVQNNGVITARAGRVALASGLKYTLDFSGDGMVQLAMPPEFATPGLVDTPAGPLGAAVSNNGSIIADGGIVALTARSAAGAMDKVINMSGVIQARSISTANGRIVLYGGDEGWVEVSGTLDASAGAGLSGGKIDVLGEKVVLGQLTLANGVSAGLLGGGTLDVSGGVSGGAVRVGGDVTQLPTDRSGSGGVKLAVETLVGFGSLLRTGGVTGSQGTAQVTGYVVYRQGNFNLIVNSGHGGTLKPSYIGLRDCTGISGCSTSADLKTSELSQTLVDTFTTLTGSTPHWITVNVHRALVDVNRAPGIANDATSAEGTKAYAAAHDALGLATTTVEAGGGRGLLVDIHGATGTTKSIELGYAIPGSVLNTYSDADLNASRYATTSTFSALGRDSLALGGTPDLARVIRGDLSLGAFLATRTDSDGATYAATPGPINSGPGVNDYFAGGYIVQHYGSGGSTSGPSVDAVQIEISPHYRTASDTARNRFARDLAASLADFMRTHY
jgi:filamentous hemagglutinin family protein